MTEFTAQLGLHRSRARRAAGIVLAVVSLGLLAASCSGGGTPSPAGLSGMNRPVTVRPSVSAADATFAFEPFVGVPGNTADELSRSIGEKAKIEGLNLVRRLDAEATYRVRGYLTAAGSDGYTTVAYVFDVFSGEQRLYRFSGQETADGSRGDPWANVDDAVLANIATRAVLALKAWLGR